MGNLGDGYVYIVRMFLPGYGPVIKIGGSSDPKGRLMQVGDDVRNFFYPKEDRPLRCHPSNWDRQNEIRLLRLVDCISWTRVERYLQTLYAPFPALVNRPYTDRAFYKGELFHLTEEQVEEACAIPFEDDEEAICATLPRITPGTVQISADLMREIEDYRSRSNARVPQRRRVSNEHIVHTAIRYYLATNPMRTPGLGHGQLGDWGPGEETLRQRANRRRHD